MTIGHSLRGVADCVSGLRRRRPMRVVLGVMLWGCVACSGRRDPSIAEPGLEPSFVHDLGEATWTDLAAEVPDVLGRLGYQLARVDGPPQIRFETEWRPRQPFADEMADGIERTDTRVVLMGRPHRGVPTAAPIYSITLRVETRGQKPEDTGWRAVPMTAESATYARRIADRLEVELRAIVRRY